jgi:hypothetical protein
MNFFKSTLCFCNLVFDIWEIDRHRKRLAVTHPTEIYLTTSFLAERRACVKQKAATR